MGMGKQGQIDWSTLPPPPTFRSLEAAVENNKPWGPLALAGGG